MRINDQATLALYNKRPINKQKELFIQKIKCPDFEVVQPLTNCNNCPEQCGKYKQLSAIYNNK